MWIRMVFNNAWLITGIVAGFLIWLGILSALLIRTISHYNRLTKGITDAGLSDVLDSIVGNLNRLAKKTAALEKTSAILSDDGLGHYQRIGIVRFNPFADTGGAQSFTIALLDRNDNGIVMTSLYARAGNRWYVKEIVSGRGKDLDLSKEEASAIAKAKSGGT